MFVNVSTSLGIRQIKIKTKSIPRHTQKEQLEKKRLKTLGIISGPMRCGTVGTHIYYKWKGKLVQPLWNMVFYYLSKFLVVKNMPAMQELQETQVRSLGWEDSLEKGIATHSSFLAWRIPQTEEPGGLQSIRSQRVGHNWSNLADIHKV